jgi:diketogulonate reductase-like aldo/keto reductase
MRTAMTRSPLITLNNGTKMPALGLGVLDRSTRELTADAVEAAIVNGHRLIDTAASYLSERQVGDGLISPHSGVTSSTAASRTSLRTPSRTSGTAWLVSGGAWRVGPSY